MTLEIYYDDGRVQLWAGDAIECARQLATGSVSCIVTSPPYYGLRDYGGADGQIGAEESLEAYVDRLADLFDELRRVLADDGTLWLNLGDSYASRWGSVRERSAIAIPDSDRTRRPTPPGYTEKQLLGVPWRVAFALQDRGWVLRRDVVWAKPNPMPESVRDRPSAAHEFVFLFSKGERYWYDADAIAEPVAESSAGRWSGETRSARDVWTIAGQPFPGAHFAVFPEELPRRCIRAGARKAGKRCDCAEVIETPTGTAGEPDPSLTVGRAGMARPRAEDEGTRPITRAQQRADAEQLRQLAEPEKWAAAVGAEAWAHYVRTDRAGARPLPPELRADLIGAGVLSAEPVAECDHQPEPAGVVLDPFSGSGTTGKVALLEGHRYIGFDLNPEYLALSLSHPQRFADQPLDLGAIE